MGGLEKRVLVHTRPLFTCQISLCNLGHFAGQVFHIRWRKSVVNMSQSSYTDLSCLLQSPFKRCLFFCPFFRSKSLDKGQERDSTQLRHEAVLCPHGLVLHPASYKAFPISHVQGLSNLLCWARTCSRTISSSIPSLRRIC